jgi:hypothetical protein
MTKMTHEILQEMFDRQKGGGLADISMDVVKDILAKHDPEGVNSFEPTY